MLVVQIIAVKIRKGIICSLPGLLTGFGVPIAVRVLAALSPSYDSQDIHFLSWFVVYVFHTLAVHVVVLLTKEICKYRREISNLLRMESALFEPVIFVEDTKP